MNKEIQDALSCLLSMALENDKYESQKEQYKIVNDYITNLQEENEDLREENEQYKKTINEIWNKANDDILDDAEFRKWVYLERYNQKGSDKEKDKEIERLNNIIKRLEEDLREMYLTFGEFSEEYTENKIKELKGDSSNE